MKFCRTSAMMIAIAVLAMGTMGLAEEARWLLKYSNGIAFSEFRGYETWQTAAPSLSDEGLKIITANPLMIQAYKEGFPGNGKPVPDGAMMAKIEWTQRKNPDSPSVLIPDSLRRVGFMVKDAKRFPDTDGWGYAQFVYDTASKTFESESNDSTSAKKLCHSCHTLVKTKDFVFTAYPVR
jgi:hypothetical protein